MRFFLFLTLAVAGFAQYVPNQYILEMEDGANNTATVMDRAVMDRAAMDRAQRTFAARGLRVKARTERVARAFVIESEAGAEALRGLPGVKRVHRVRLFHPSLQGAANAHGLQAAYDRVGREKAGQGIKIGIIDSGIELTHPGFNAANFTMPEGYPRSSAGHEAFTNAKVIVARSYPQLWARADPNPTPLDRIGHGTAVAMAAAGVLHEGPSGPIAGMAPGAWLGAYKVFGSPGVNEGATDASILAAIEDSVNDGMDIINLSLGSILAPRPEDDILVQALERASRAGVLVVVAAGNDGPGVATLSSPATGPNVLAVGANENALVYRSAVQADSSIFMAIPGQNTSSSGTLTGTLVSIRQWDESGLACRLLPTGSLDGRVALIERGNCEFEFKLNAAMAAGAVGAIVYGSTAAPEDLFVMGTGRAVLPSVMVRRADGLQLLQRLGEASPLPITVRLTPQAFASNAERLASFSSRGPLPGVALKPEILAVGVGVLTAAQTNTPSGAVYSASGYRTIQGTSFSAPVVAGILAVLKSERPGLTTAAYRSLLVQSASPIEGVPLAQQGAGLARLEGALTNLLTLSNSTISFRENTEALEIRNLSGELQSVALSVESRRGVAPGLAESTVEIGANGSARLQLALDRAAVPAGTHEGFVVLRAAAGPAAGTVARVPYWFGKTSGTATAIQLLDATNVARAGVPQRDLLLFRVLDENGLALEEAPVVRVAAGTAQVREVQRRDGEVAGAWGLELTLGAGVNRLEIQAAGGLTRTITITGI